MMAALHAGVGARDHVVAQVVEAEFGVGAVGDIGLVGQLLGLGAHAVLDKAHAHAQKLIHLPHPLAVAARQVIVDGDDVHVLPAESVEIAGKRGHERLALARAHLGDLAVVEDHAADELDVEVTHAQRSHRRLAHRRERLGKHVGRGGACLHAAAQLIGERAQLLIGFRLHLGLEAADLVGQGLVVLQLLAFAEREQLGEETCHMSAIPFSAGPVCRRGLVQSVKL